MFQRKATEDSFSRFPICMWHSRQCGGAVYMNAGAYDGEISFVIESAEVLMIIKK